MSWFASTASLADGFVSAVTSIRSLPGSSRLLRRDRDLLSERHVRIATACSHVEYRERPANRPLSKKSLTNTSCAASSASCTLPINRQQTRQTRSRNRSIKAVNAAPSEPSRAARAANCSSLESAGCSEIVASTFNRVPSFGLPLFDSQSISCRRGPACHKKIFGP